MDIKKNDLFHVHTYRCGHAENVPDEEYIKKAISIGATGIWFTDHAPFPEDPFGNRMRYAELDEYIETLSILKNKYADKLDVHVGLEIEYFPTYDKKGYYKYLSEKDNIDILLLGQHMAETTPGHYTFGWNKEKLISDEYIALGNALIQGIRSRYFNAVAHPDRIFRRQKKWSEDAEKLSKLIIQTAQQMNIPLEINEESKRQKYHYWNEFWILAAEIQCINGLDAHSLKAIRLL